MITVILKILDVYADTEHLCNQTTNTKHHATVNLREFRRNFSQTGVKKYKKKLLEKGRRQLGPTAFVVV